MKYWIAAGLTFAGGMALSTALYGEGAVGMVGLIGVPGLLVTLFLAPALSSGRPGSLGRVGAWAAVLLAVGLLLLFAVAPMYALLLEFLAMLLLSIGWPLAASAALLMAIASVRAEKARGAARSDAPARAGGTPARASGGVLGGTSGGVLGGARVWGRMAWTWLLALAATYGFGLTHFDDDMQDVKDSVCRVTFEPAAAGHEGGQTFLPLSDTSCGADTVPGFVNPLLAVLASLLVVCLAGYGGARLRSGRPRPAA